jgi:hypothetical protein
VVVAVDVVRDLIAHLRSGLVGLDHRGAFDHVCIGIRLHVVEEALVSRPGADRS